MVGKNCGLVAMRYVSAELAEALVSLVKKKDSAPMGVVGGLEWTPCAYRPVEAPWAAV